MTQESPKIAYFGPHLVNFYNNDHLLHNTTKNDHFMIDFKFLAEYGSTVAEFHHPDF